MEAEALGDARDGAVAVRRFGQRGMHEAKPDPLHVMRDAALRLHDAVERRAAEPMACIFRGLCTYPHLAAAGNAGSPDGASDHALAAAAGEVLQRCEAEGSATTDLTRAARAAAYGAVDTLLVELEAEVPGMMGENGAISFGGTEGGLTEEIARRALETGAHVVVTQAVRIPGGGHLAAILRYPV